MDEELRAYLVAMEERLRTEISITRADLGRARIAIMQRIDRLQNALTLEREEKLVDQSAILLMRRQIQHLQDRVQTLEEKP